MRLIRNRADLHEEMKSIILETTGDLRRAITRVVRGECKDFLAEYGEKYLAASRERLEKIIDERLAQLGSAAHAPGQLDRELRRAFTVLERDHRKMLFTLPPEVVCRNAACNTQEPVPHMLDERDHRTFGEVAKAYALKCICPADFSALPDFSPLPDCPRHGDPKVLAQLKENL